MAKVIECAQAHYEVQDVEFGKIYKWCPERVVVECQCGQRLSLSASMTSCLFTTSASSDRRGASDVEPDVFAGPQREEEPLPAV